METEFWKKRWRTNEVGWHASVTNRHLERFVSTLGPVGGNHTLVPLCGKSLDMDFLARQGRSVFGIDVSPVACRSFFEETGRRPTERQTESGKVLEGDGVTLLCQDLFAIQPGGLPEIGACYDRACLIALAPPQRRRYATWLRDVLSVGTPYLLITVEYPPNQKNGPPFTVPMEEVRELFEADFDIEVVHRADIVDEAPKYREWGVTSLIETVYTMRRCKRGNDE